MDGADALDRNGHHAIRLTLDGHIAGLSAGGRGTVGDGAVGIVDGELAGFRRPHNGAVGRDELGEQRVERARPSIGRPVVVAEPALPTTAGSAAEEPKQLNGVGSGLLQRTVDDLVELAASADVRRDANGSCRARRQQNQGGDDLEAQAHDDRAEYPTPRTVWINLVSPVSSSLRRRYEMYTARFLLSGPKS